MTEFVSQEALLDEALTATLGPVDSSVGEAIVGICNDAVEQVLGPALAETLRSDPSRVALVVPWVWDLARGLQFQSLHNQSEWRTVELLAILDPRPQDREQLKRFAESIDVTTALTLDRLLDPVLGPGACTRPPEANDAAAPWLEPLRLGYRIHLALELLRLTASH